MNHDLTGSAECEREFRAHFGLAPSSVLSLWNNLCLPNPRVPVLPRNAQLKHLLWALLHMKVYGSEATLSRMCKTNRKTFRLWVRAMMDAIYETMGFYVSSHVHCFTLCLTRL